MTSSSTLKQFELEVHNRWTHILGNPEHQDVRSLAKYLCEAHSQKKISDATFTLLLEGLLSFYIEKRLGERLLKKSDEFDRRLSRYLMRSMLFE